jgi:hypothetical protein
MYNEWIAAEHHRIHVMELWPDGPRKEAGLVAAWHALESLTRAIPKGSSFVCTTCSSRRQTLTVIPCAPRVQTLPAVLAA